MYHVSYQIETSDLPPAIGRLPALSNIAIQPSAVEFLLLAFRGLTSADASSSSLVAGDAVNTSLPTSRTTASGTRSNPVPSTPSPPESTSGNANKFAQLVPGHYSDGLDAVNSKLLEDVKKTFEVGHLLQMIFTFKCFKY